MPERISGESRKVPKLRILLASDHYPPFIGGAHRQIALLGRELSARGHAVSVATIDQPDLPRRETDDEVDVHRFRQLRSLLPSLGGAQRQRHHPPFADPVTTSGLRRLVRDFEPDVVHSYGWISFSCARALRRTNIPLIISARDYAYSCPTRIMMRRSEPCAGPDLGKCLACASRHYGVVKGVAAVGGVRAHHRSLRKRVRGVHSISSYVRDITRRDFLGTDDSADIDGVAEMVIPSFRENMYTPEDDVDSYLEKLPAAPSILFVGALRRVKGIVELLAAYESLVDPPPLVLIGTLERDTPRELPDGVHIVGDFPHDAVLAAMDRSLFAVFPSLWPEPFGSVVHEAMSRGLAVIGTKPGGHEDMIDDNETGRLVPRGDVGALADAMRELLDDPVKRVRLGESALLRSRLFTVAETLPRFEALYREVVGGISETNGIESNGAGSPHGG